MVLSRHTIMANQLPFLVTCFAFWSQFDSGYGLTMFAPINAFNLTGNITFEQSINQTSVTVTVNLFNLFDQQGQRGFKWKIATFPYRLEYQCPETLGPVIKDMTPEEISVPINGSPFVDSDIQLIGPKSIWSASIIYQVTSASRPACANILLEGQSNSYKAQFLGPEFSGTVYIRTIENGPTVFVSQLGYSDGEFRVKTEHDWKILVPEYINPITQVKCHHLKDILTLDNDGSKQSRTCSTSEHEGCVVGDLTAKLGKLTIFSDDGKLTNKQRFVDTNLPGYALESRSLYLVVYQKNDSKRPLSCAKISPVNDKKVKATFDMDGVKGYIGFSQNFFTDPTIVTIKLKNLKNRGVQYKIHEFPVDPMQEVGENICSNNVLGSMFNPFGHKLISGPGLSTTEYYPLGDLSGKYGHLPTTENLEGEVFSVHVDLYLPLFGTSSIIGRSLVIQKADESNWICATIGYPGSLTTAVATFHYPIMGKIIFRQEAFLPSTETTVYADLSYSDGSNLTTTDHNFYVHIDPPGADWFNWTRRCSSTGDRYNPHKVGSKNYAKNCNYLNPYRCDVGDLTVKSRSKLKIANNRGSSLVKVFYVDRILHLSGPHSIIGRSIVIKDTNGPVARGDRLACAKIKQLHQLSVNVPKWRQANGISKVTGSFKAYQDTIHDGTEVVIQLNGLARNADGFHVHKVFVPMDAQFPCADSAIQGHWDPFMISTNSNLSVAEGVGSTDQYEIADISGKTEGLKNKTMHHKRYIDHNLPLHGINSIVGRSIVIHYLNTSRWVCGTIRPEISKSRGREIIALASFHDSRHVISGYLKFRQIEYTDGSTSDTWIDVDLQNKGDLKGRLTKDHKWEVFVNPVSGDAYQPTEAVRCQGGGYIYNPLQTVKNPDYKKQCKRVNPLRCQLGDLTGRHGPLEIGGDRKLFTDVNLPLTGPYSVVGRPLVIYVQGEDSPGRLACTNILLNQHSQFSTSIRKTPGFTVENFITSMRTQLRTPKWLIVPDLETYSSIFDDQCVMLIVHFYGPNAKKLHETFNRLIQAGTVQYSDDQGTYTLTTPYKPCNGITSESVSAANRVILSSIIILSIVAVGVSIGALIIRRKKF